jgi:hypothetical protein
VLITGIYCMETEMVFGFNQECDVQTEADETE